MTAQNGRRGKSVTMMEADVLAVAAAVRAELVADCGGVDGMCCIAALWIVDFFRALGLDATVVHGAYEGEYHEWVELSWRGQRYVLDVTLDQFDARLPAIVWEPRGQRSGYTTMA